MLTVLMGQGALKITNRPKNYKTGAPKFLEIKIIQPKKNLYWLSQGAQLLKEW